ncbi:MAG: MATE family efflux transporter [Lachnospiraceae bacterium]|nr:MATE family efflux transporter [Lachnospiraceae bacterium]
MQQKDEQYEKMIKTPLPKLITVMAVPTIISMLITSIYNITDTWFVSKLGTSASAATGIVFSLQAIIQAIGFTVGTGAGSVISRLLGKKDSEEAKEVATTALVTSFVFGGLLSGIGLMFLERLIRGLGATDTILPYAMDYARYILYVTPLITASFVLNNLLRAEGRTVLAMLGIGIGGVLNIILDWVLIFAANMGIMGAAVATAISQSVGFLILLICFFTQKTVLRFSLKYLSKDFSLYKEFLSNGMPSLFRQGLASVASVALNHVAAGYGDAAVAAMSVAGKIFMLVYCILIGFAQAYQPIVGYNYGAKEYERVRKAYRFTLWTGNIGMSVFGIVQYTLAPWLLERFVSDDSQVKEIGMLALRMQSLVMPLLALGVVCNMTFQAVGKNAVATFLAACRQGVFFLPLIWFLPKIWGSMGMKAAQPIADVATFVVCLPFIWKFMRELKENSTDKCC